jgi:hypothetical protein
VADHGPAGLDKADPSALLIDKDKVLEVREKMNMGH